MISTDDLSFDKKLEANIYLMPPHADGAGYNLCESKVYKLRPFFSLSGGYLIYHRQSIWFLVLRRSSNFLLFSLVVNLTTFVTHMRAHQRKSI